MSKNIVPIGVKQAIKPDFLDLHDMTPSFVVNKGARQIRYYELKPTSGGNETGTENTGTTIFNLFAPTRETVMDPNLYLSAEVSVNLTSIDDNVNVFSQQMQQGLRAFPITSQCIKTCNVEIDGNGVDVNLSELQKHLINYVYTEEELKQQNTMTPCLVSDNYSTTFMSATNSNPLGNIKDMSYSAVPSRAAFPLKSVTYGGSATTTSKTTGSLKYVITEVLPISPLSLKAGQYDTDPLYNVSNIKINISWNSSQNCFNNAFCKQVTTDASVTDVLFTVAANGAVTVANGFDVQSNRQVTGTIVLNNITLLVGFYTPEITQVIPETLFLDYKKFLYFTQNVPCPETGYTTSAYNFDTKMISLPITLNNIQLSQMPRWVMFAVFNNGNNYTYTGTTHLPYYGQTSTYCAINKIDLTVGNDSGILSTCTPQNLYQMNVKNGLKNVSWATSGMHGQLLPVSETFVAATGAPAHSTSTFGFVTPIGSPLKLMFGEDIQITDPLLAPGVSSNINFSAILTVSVPYFTVRDAANPFNLTVQTIFCYDGLCTISRNQGGVYFSTSVIDKQDVIESGNFPIDGSQLDARTYGDGSFMKKLKKFTRSAARSLPGLINKGVEYGKKGIDFVEKHQGDIEKAAATAALMAAGGKGGRMVAGQIVGGAQTMNRGQLRRRLQVQ